MHFRVENASRIAGIVLAAGLSGRFGPENKLLAPVGGCPIIRRSVSAFTQAGLDPVLVVLGHEGDRVADALLDLPVQFVHNPEYLEGQSRSLVRGIHAVAATAEAAIIGVADQPFLTAEVVRALVHIYAESAAPLVVPRYDGQRGNPVLFDRSLFPELLQVAGDQGGRPVIERHRRDIVWVDIADRRAGLDCDTATAYERISAEER